MDLASQQKAIAGGLVTAIVALIAHFGFRPDAATMNFLSVIVTVIVGYAAGHIVVYKAPKNVDPLIEPPTNQGA